MEVADEYTTDAGELLQRRASDRVPRTARGQGKANDGGYRTEPLPSAAVELLLSEASPRIAASLGKVDAAVGNVGVLLVALLVLVLVLPLLLRRAPDAPPLGDAGPATGPWLHCSTFFLTPLFLPPSPSDCCRWGRSISFAEGEEKMFSVRSLARGSKRIQAAPSTR